LEIVLREPKNSLQGGNTRKILSDFLSLSASSLSSQLISVFCVYVLASKFGADIFGAYSLFLAYASIIVIFSSLSFEQAFPSLGGKDFDAMVYLTTVLAMVVSVVTYVCAELFGYSLSTLLGVFVATNSIGRLGELMAVRSKMYTIVATLRVIPNILFLVMILYLVSIESFRLDSILLANIISFSISWLGIYAVSFKSQVHSLPSFSRIINVLIIERRFVFFVAPSQVFNRLALNLPLILIDKFYGSFFVGQYALIQRIGFGPVSLIGAATSQIFIGHLGDLKRGEVNGTFDLPFKSIKRNLIASGFFITFCFLILLPVVLPVVMPNEWDDAIKIGIILAPSLGLTLVAYPLTSVFTVYKMHGYLLFNQLAYFFIAGISFVGGYWGIDYLYCVACYSFLSSLRYCFLYIKANSIITKNMSLV